MTGFFIDGPYSGSFGAGTAEAADDTYRFDTSTPATPLSLTLTGNDFTTDPDGIDMTMAFTLGIGTVVQLPLQEAVLTGTFNTEERCAIGEQVTDTPPTEWITEGTLTGLITVTDAQAIQMSAQIATITLDFTLCAFLAYGLESGLVADPDCQDTSAWLNAPDATTQGGESAWQVTSEYTETGILLL